MAEKMEKRFPGHADREIYQRLVTGLADVAKQYALKLDTDDEALQGRIHRLGAVDVKFAVAQEALSATLDFGMLIPKSIRQKIKDELDRRLDDLFA